MTDFRLHCVVCDNAMDYFRYLLRNYRDLASAGTQIEVVAHCTDDESFQKVQQEGLADQAVAVHRHPEFYVYGNRHDIWNRIKLFWGGSPALSGSSGHAAGLKSAFKMTGGGKIDIIADTDTVIVYPKWDVFLSQILEEHAIIGTSYEERDSFSSGNKNVQTYKTSPNLTWVALSPRYPFQNLDAGHILWKNLPIKTQEDADLYGLKIGDELLRDVGWKIPAFLRANNARAVVLKHAKPGSPSCKVITTSNAYNEEFQLNGVPVVVHQRGSRKHAFRSQPLSAPFYDAAEKYIASLQTETEKKSTAFS